MATRAGYVADGLIDDAASVALGGGRIVGAYAADFGGASSIRHYKMVTPSGHRWINTTGDDTGRPEAASGPVHVVHSWLA